MTHFGMNRRAIAGSAFLFILILTTHLFSQQNGQGRTYTVRGQILSLVDNLPLANIQVQLSGTDFTGVTNEGGQFEIKGVPRGEYDVIAKYPDFDVTVLRNVQVPPQSRQEFVFELDPVEDAEPLPYTDVIDLPDSLGAIEGEIIANLEQFSASLGNGQVILKATVAGNLTKGFLYPKKWKLLPDKEQTFRFKFVLPKGEKYRLYLVWQETKDTYIEDRIIDVVRAAASQNQAALFDLTVRDEYKDVSYTLDVKKIGK